MIRDLIKESAMVRVKEGEVHTQTHTHTRRHTHTETHTHTHRNTEEHKNIDTHTLKNIKAHTRTHTHTHRTHTRVGPRQTEWGGFTAYRGGRKTP